MLRPWVVWGILGLIGAAAVGDVHAQSFQLLAKGQPDQWYTGIGGPYFTIDQAQPPDAIPKVNQDYVWSMADGGSTIWFGTGGGTAAAASASSQLIVGREPSPFEAESRDTDTKLFAWEFGSSMFPGIPDQLKAYLGDWRPPKFYQYNPSNGQLIDRTPNDPLVNITLGLRSAGSANGVVLFGGLSYTNVGICMFAFDANTGEFLGSRLLPRYSNIRRWINTPQGLYTSVLNTTPAVTRGAVIRWAGNRTNPFAFTTVGLLDNQGAYMTYHNDRLIVGTWQQDSVLPAALRQVPELAAVLPPLELPPLSGLWMSPALRRTGLLPVHAAFWQKIWDPTAYEPDSKLALGYSMGALESFGDSLYFGTLHFPNSGAAAFLGQYGYSPPRPPGDSGIPRNASERSIIILKATGLGGRTPATFELLYGNEQVPVYTPDPDPMVQSGTWAMVTNNYGQAGTYGDSGFGNDDNAYTWSSAVYNNKLYFGTYDDATWGTIGSVVDGIKNGTPRTDHDGGGDLWCFNDTSSAAVAISREGYGNPANHGARNMLSTASGLYIGTSNSQSLLTDDTDGLPVGGWELRKLVP